MAKTTGSPLGSQAQHERASRLSEGKEERVCVALLWRQDKHSTQPQLG